MSTYYTTLNSALKTVARRLEGINHNLYQTAKDAYNSHTLNITYLAAKTLTLHPESGTYTIKDTSNAELEEIVTNAINGEVETDYTDYDTRDYYVNLGEWEIDEGLITELTHVDSFIDWPTTTKATINVDIAASYNDTFEALYALPVLSEDEISGRTRFIYHAGETPHITVEQKLVSREDGAIESPKPIADEDLQWEELPKFHELVANLDTSWLLDMEEPITAEAIRSEILASLADAYPKYKSFFLEDMTNVEVIVD